MAWRTRPCLLLFPLPTFLFQGLLINNLLEEDKNRKQVLVSKPLRRDTSVGGLKDKGRLTYYRQQPLWIHLMTGKALKAHVLVAGHPSASSFKEKSTAGRNAGGHES